MGGRGSQWRREGQARKIWAYMGPSLTPFFPNHFLSDHLLPKDLLDYYLLPHPTATLSLPAMVQR